MNNGFPKIEKAGAGVRGQKAGLRAAVLNMPLILGLALGLIACSSTPKNPSPPAMPKLTLNEGKKWVIVEPMMIHLRSLEKSVEQFDPAWGSKHEVLAAEIQEDLGRLATNCTMEGKAHDELHRWLMPFLALSTGYANANDPSIQDQKLREIRDSLVVFNSYFE